MQSLCDDVQDLVKAVENGTKILQNIADTERKEAPQPAPVVNVSVPPAVVNVEAKPLVSVIEKPRSFTVTFKRDNYGNITSADIRQT